MNDQKCHCAELGATGANQRHTLCQAHDALRHHVSGAVERGEKEAIVSVDPRAVVLASWIDEDDVTAEDLEDIRSPHDETVYSFGDREYMILTDDEANEKAREYIADSLWAFTASFIVDYLPEGVGEEVVEALQPQCESANEAIRSMVGERFNDLVEDAISADGRGHFLSTYDGNEHEHEHDGTYWYIYRMN